LQRYVRIVADTKRTIELTDPRALRALAHPTRLRLVGLLRTHGPLTATRAGEMLGESSGSCSFHLRQLARYGLVEEAGGGHGREKPWRATARYTSWPSLPSTPETAAATQMLNRVIVDRYYELLHDWIEVRPSEPPEWQQAEQFGDTLVYLTADELSQLGQEVTALVERYADRFEQPSARPPGARMVSYIHLAFPWQESRR
jgi:DNA-binding transcriptional ArsR family regulator